MRSRVSMKLNRLIFILCLSVNFNSFGAIEDIFKGKTEIENPMDLRDPFLAPRIKVQKESKVVGRVSKGVYSNIPQLGEVKLDDLEITGVIIGKERRAFVKLKNAPAKNTYTIKEGDVLGENRAELRAILPGGLVLVEKTTNIYGEEEYLETVIPLSK